MVSISDFTVFDFSLVVFAIIGVSFAIVWIVVSFYQLYPYTRLFIAPILGTDRPLDELYVESSVVEKVPTEELPSIDILLPAYKEGNVIQQSIRSIRDADYPQQLITIHVLLEPEDEDTRSALRAIEDELRFRERSIPERYSHIVVPDTYPGLPNKPRALNYGFEMSDGDVVGVIDAEDIVAKDLFYHVYAGLVIEDRDFVQGILDMVNEEDGWLNTLFRAEYATWFRWLLPAFHFAEYPVPLGGTTNFFHRDVLEAISERRYAEYGDPWTQSQWEWFDEAGLRGSIPWDPRNVTEDFELGLFLWKEGYEIGLLRAVTREESPLSLDAWIRQRTRWQKGKIYTFIRYAYDPPASWNSKFHLFLQSFLPHIAPINIAGIVILALTANILGMGMPIGIFIALTVSLVFLVWTVTIYGVSYWHVTDVSPPIKLLRTIEVLVTLPIYWLPLWGAELRSMRQIYTKDLSWEKTPHHGRNTPTTVSGAQLDVERRDVVIGLLVLVLGLFITVGLPVWVTG